MGYLQKSLLRSARDVSPCLVSVLRRMEGRLRGTGTGDWGWLMVRSSPRADGE